LEHGERHNRDFFNWYNGEHHHVSLGLMTPNDMHHGLAGEVRRRQLALLNAYAAHPERYPRSVGRDTRDPESTNVVDSPLSTKSPEVLDVFGRLKGSHP
jgi:putative transposase